MTEPDGGRPTDDAGPAPAERDLGQVFGESPSGAGVGERPAPVVDLDTIFGDVGRPGEPTGGATSGGPPAASGVDPGVIAGLFDPPASSRTAGDGAPVGGRRGGEAQAPASLRPASSPVEPSPVEPSPVEPSPVEPSPVKVAAVEAPSPSPMAPVSSTAGTRADTELPSAPVVRGDSLDLWDRASTPGQGGGGPSGPSGPSGRRASVPGDGRSRRSDDATGKRDEVAATPLDQLRRSGPPRSRWWSVGFPVVIALVVIAVPLLVLMGKDTILDSTDGNVVAPVDDPRSPGYVAEVEPTETLLVLDVAADGSLSAATVLALTGPTSGGVVSVPPDTVMPGVDGSVDSLANAFAAGGPDGVRAMVEAQLNAAMSDVKVVAAADWSALVAAVAPIAVNNPDDVVQTAPDGSMTTRFEAGDIELGADDVADYLGSRNPGESDLNRMVRQQRFWAAWLKAVADAGDDPAVVPGEVDSGLGHAVRALAAAQVELQTLPVQRVPIPGAATSPFDPLDELVVPLVARLVPYPVGAPPGARLVTRILDGTGRLQQGLPAAPRLVLGGAEIAVIGNAATFDRQTTQIVYRGDGQRAGAEKLRDALGVGELVVSAEPSDAADVTVILGADAVDVLGDATISTSTLPPTSAAAEGSDLSPGSDGTA